MRQVLAVACLWGILASHSVWAMDVGYAGLAYAGDYATITKRFPYISQIAPPHAVSAGGLPSEFEKQLLAGVQKSNPENFHIVTDSLTTLENRDQAVMVALVVTGETVSTERFGNLTKLFINLRAQALFFDFKSMMVLRAYPISLVYLDAPPNEPTDIQKSALVQQVLLGNGNTPGLVDLFVKRVSEAKLPSSVTRYVGVSAVHISPEIVSMLPAYFDSTGVAETWIADQLSDSLLDKDQLPVIPYAKGYAVGNTMATHLADGTVFNLKLPVPDYAISIDLQGLKKVKYAEVPAGTSFIYGSLIHIQVTEPVSGHSYFDASLKNGEVKLVPSDQLTVDDWPAFEDSLRGLFNKYASTMSGTDDKWIKSAASGDNVLKQATETQKVFNSCK